MNTPYRPDPDSGDNDYGPSINRTGRYPYPATGGKTIGGKTINFGSTMTGNASMAGHSEIARHSGMAGPMMSGSNDDVFDTSNAPPSKPNLFSGGGFHGKSPSFRVDAQSYGAVTGGNYSEFMVKLQNGDGDDDDHESSSDVECYDEEDDVSEKDVEAGSEDDDEQDPTAGSVLILTAPKDNKQRVGPHHESVPQAKNQMHVYRSKEETASDPDPNGRNKGRNLVPWHRPRMMAKLILHIQYECHLAQIRLPWDKIAHRLHPGASGPAIIQFLNKNRDVLVQEGHLIPPNMGKSKAVYDDTIRGYVRDEAEEISTKVRILPWDEPYEDKKVSLIVPGVVKGSGKYDRNKANRPTVAKEIGRRSRVPEQTKAKMAEIRTKRKRKLRLERDDSENKVAEAKDSLDIPAGQVAVNSMIALKPKVALNHEVATNPEVDFDAMVELEKQDSGSEYGDYQSHKSKSGKRKGRAVHTGGRKKARQNGVASSFKGNEDVTPISKQTSSAGPTPNTVGSRLMAEMSIDTPTKSSRRQGSVENAKTAGQAKRVGSSDVVEQQSVMNPVPDQSPTSLMSNRDEGQVNQVDSQVFGIGQRSVIHPARNQTPDGLVGNRYDGQFQLEGMQTPQNNGFQHHQHAPSSSSIGNQYAQYPIVSGHGFSSSEDAYAYNYHYALVTGDFSAFSSPFQHGMTGNNGGNPSNDNPHPGSFVDMQRNSRSNQLFMTTPQTIQYPVTGGHGDRRHAEYGNHANNGVGMSNNGPQGMQRNVVRLPPVLMQSGYPQNMHHQNGSFNMPNPRIPSESFLETPGRFANSPRSLAHLVLDDETARNDGHAE